MTPIERFRQSEKLFAHYLAIGGSLDPDPDPTSPFYDPQASSTGPAYGRAGLRVLRARQLLVRIRAGLAQAGRAVVRAHLAATRGVTALRHVTGHHVVVRDAVSFCTLRVVLQRVLTGRALLLRERRVAGIPCPA